VTLPPSVIDRSSGHPSGEAGQNDPKSRLSILSGRTPPPEHAGIFLDNSHETSEGIFPAMSDFGHAIPRSQIDLFTQYAVLFLTSKEQHRPP